MSDSPQPLKVGDIVWVWPLGEPPIRGAVSRINGLRTYPWLYTVSVTLDHGRPLICAPSSVYPGEMPPLTRRTPLVPELPGTEQSAERPTPPEPKTPPSDTALASAIAEWEDAVNEIEAFPDLWLEEFQQAVFSRESLRNVAADYAHLELKLAAELVEKIDHADQRYRACTLPWSCLFSHRNYDPEQFWFYYRSSPKMR